MQKTGHSEERRRRATPEALAASDGTIAFGTFDEPFRRANILDAKLYSFYVPSCWKVFRLKEWQHFGIITPSHYFGLVIFDAKFMGVSFFYVFDRQTRQMFEYELQKMGRKTILPEQTYEGAVEFSAAGYSIGIVNALDKGFHRIRIGIRGDAQKPDIAADLVIHEDLNRVEPLVQVSKISPHRPLYTHKAAVPASGTVDLGARRIVLDPQTAIALIDEQKTYYPYFSFWKWATGAGRTDQGKILGFNVCQTIMEDDADNNENCFWIDGKIHYLKGARFEFGDYRDPWKMKTTDGRLDLTFEPAGERAQKVNIAGLIKSDFHQPLGLFNGRYTDPSGVVHPIKDVFGLAEHHVTRY